MTMIVTSKDSDDNDAEYNTQKATHNKKQTVTTTKTLRIVTVTGSGNDSDQQ